MLFLALQNFSESSEPVKVILFLLLVIGALLPGIFILARAARALDNTAQPRSKRNIKNF